MTSRRIGAPQGVIGADVQIDEFELAVLGWSAREQRTIGRVWGYWDGETNSQEVTADAPHTAPWDESLRGKQTLARHGERHCVAAFMRDQIRLLEKKALNAAGGGRIIAATVRKHSVNVENWGLLARIRPAPRSDVSARGHHDPEAVRALMEPGQRQVQSTRSNPVLRNSSMALPRQPKRGDRVVDRLASQAAPRQGKVRRIVRVHARAGTEAGSSSALVMFSIGFGSSDRTLAVWSFSFSRTLPESVAVPDRGPSTCQGSARPSDCFGSSR